jgi:polyisoprenoid-binding protein YceI
MNNLLAMKQLLVFFLSVFSSLALAQDSYTLSAESELTIDGTSTAQSWAVTANEIKSNLMVQDGLVSTINLEVVVASISSNRSLTMDKKMHTALKSKAYPKVSFIVLQIEQEAVLKGILSIAGVEKSVAFNAEITFQNDTWKIKGVKKIMLKDFEIEPPSAMFGQIVVGGEVSVKFDLVFELRKK